MLFFACVVCRIQYPIYKNPTGYVAVLINRSGKFGNYLKLWSWKIGYYFYKIYKSLAFSYKIMKYILFCISKEMNNVF